MSEVKKEGERLQKIIAQVGVASRRDAEELIRDGLVTVNGKVAALGDKAVLGKDAIKVKGKLITAPATKAYYVIYKPKNVIAMIHEDEEGRPTLKDFLKRINERLFPIGRMDFTGEGAILLTNDGDLAQKISKSNEIIRRYHVKVDRTPSSEDLARLARGGRIESRSMTPYHVRLVESYTRNALVEISFEGMGALDVRKYFENKGFFPEKVARVGIGHISAEKLKPGETKRLERSSVEALLTQPDLAKRQISSLVGAKAKGGVKVVSEEILEKDAAKKRFGKQGLFEDSRAGSKPSPANRGAKRAEKRTEKRSEKKPLGARKPGSATKSAPGKIQFRAPGRKSR